MASFSGPLELTVIMYHYVRDPGDAAEAGSGILGLPSADFEAQLDHLARQYEMIAWPDLRQSLQGQKPLPPAACLLTFDDGVRDHYLNVFPALRARGLSGLFFALARQEGEGLALAHQIHFLLAALGLEGLREAIWRRLNPPQRAVYQQAERHYRARYSPSSLDPEVNVLKSILQRELSAEAEMILGELFERHLGSQAKTAGEFYLNRDEMREMAAGSMHFGGHSHRHPWLDWIAPDEQAEEIAASAAWLRQMEAGPRAFAYPYGGIHARLPKLLQAHGFAAAFTTVEQVRHTHPFFIGRLDGESLALALGRGDVQAPYG